MRRGHILGGTGGLLVSRAALGGGGSGQLGTLTAADANFAMGTDPLIASPPAPTLTLTQTGAQYGFARITLTGTTSAFTLVSIEGQTLAAPILLNDASIPDLLAVAWGDGATDPKSVNITFGAAGGVGVGSYTLTLNVEDVDGNVVLSPTLGQTVADGFAGAVSAIPEALYFYTPRDLAIGALAAGNVTAEDIIGAGVDAVFGTNAMNCEIKSSSLLSPSLSKCLWRLPGVTAGYSDRVNYDLGRTTNPGITDGTWFFVVEVPQHASAGFNRVVHVDGLTTGWPTQIWKSEHGLRQDADDATMICSYNGTPYVDVGPIACAAVVRPATDYYTWAITIDASKNVTLTCAAVGNPVYPASATGVGVSAFGQAVFTASFNLTTANFNGNGIIAAACFSKILSNAELAALHNAAV